MKDVAAADCVSKIIYNFESTAVQSWISANEACLVSLQFPEFVITLKKKFLPRTWENDLVQEQIMVQGLTNLLTWVNKVWNANDELRAASSPYHIPDNHFCLHLLPCLSDGMKHLYKANNRIAPGTTKGMLDAIADFDDWLKCLELLELDLQAACGTTWVVHATKASNVLKDSNIVNMTMTAPNNATAYVPLTALPPLTDPEKDLLRLHQGCFKCCIFYVEHIS